MKVKKDVHTEHCCIAHGCKYMDKKCTVTTRKKPQSGRCYDCYEDGFDVIPNDGRSMNAEDFDLLREIINKGRYGQPYKHLLPEMQKRFKESPEFKRIVGESLPKS